MKDEYGYRLPTEAECLKVAGRALTKGILRTMSMDPHEAALGAYIPNVTPSVEELEAQIRGFHAEAEARAAKKCGQNVGKHPNGDS
ncbi:hypothetical protein [Leucobacter chromiiresistens]|uniref:hypothetical protein n=1 Tax=Leucobacter chromiiresistens TaxID=1079994 RepID=UPI00115F963F|nr:hypothetical protein [Leucobacter chromiiresistens]